MSSCAVIQTSQDVPQALDVVATSGNSESGEEQNKTDNTDKKNPQIKSYTQDELLDLRATPAALKKPAGLPEEFYTENGIWDPGAWHKAVNSRSSTPSVDGRTTKRGDIYGDTIELTPQRKSFHEGCHVQQNKVDSQTYEKQSFSKQLQNEGKSRLTGRAAGQRKSLEKAYFQEKEELKERKFIKAKDADDTRVVKRERDSKYVERNVRHRDSESSLPEWAIDGPTSQSDIIELKGFDDDAERRDCLRKKANVPRGRQKETDPRERTRKVSGEQRSSVPQATTDSKKDSLDSVHDSNKENEKPRGENINEEKPHSRKATPVDKFFEFNDVVDMFDLVPTDMFNDEDSAGKSRFSEWFQQSRSSSRGSGSSGSRPGSVPLFQDQLAAAAFARAMTPENSSMMSNSYFTPIQPAPTCNVPPAEAPSLLEILQKARSSSKPLVKKEIRGRMTVDDIEPPKNDESVTAAEQANIEEKKTSEQSAFEKLVQTMKKSGQLPEKPAPVVTGLPDHLLPKPPRKTSPTFEKLKRQLSRSPSPHGFINKPCSSVSPHTGLLTPEYFKQSHMPRTMPPSEFFKHAQNTDRRPRQHHYVNSERYDRTDNRYLMADTEESVGQEEQCKANTKVPTAFLPTSVMKKMHTDKVEKDLPVKAEASFPRAVGQPIGYSKYQDDAMSEQLNRACELPFSSPSSSRDSLTSLFSSPHTRKTYAQTSLTQSWHNSPSSTGVQYQDPTPRNVEHLLNAVMQHHPPFSAPNTPSTRSTGIGADMSTQSAPATPHRDSTLNPPAIQRLVSAPNFAVRSAALSEEVAQSPVSSLSQNEYTSTVRHNSGADLLQTSHPKNQDGEFDFYRKEANIPHVKSSASEHLSDNCHTLTAIETVKSFDSSNSEVSEMNPPNSTSQNDRDEKSVQQVTSLFHENLSSESLLPNSDDNDSDRVGILSDFIDRVKALPQEESSGEGTTSTQSSDVESLPNIQAQSNINKYGTQPNKFGHGAWINTNRKNVSGPFPVQKPASGPRKRVSPPIPTPLQPTPLTGSLPPSLLMNRSPGMSNASAAIAAQALVHQHMMAQAARAQVLQAAQLYQQQQQQHVLRAHVQAAIMAQNIGRNKQVAYKPRPAYPPTLTLTPMPRSQQNSYGPTISPLLLQQQQQQHPFLARGVVQPTPEYPVKDMSNHQGASVNTENTATNPLAKWFGNDILKTTQKTATIDPTAKAKMICVEEIEQMQ